MRICPTAHRQCACSSGTERASYATSHQAHPPATPADKVSSSRAQLRSKEISLPGPSACRIVLGIQFDANELGAAAGRLIAVSPRRILLLTGFVEPGAYSGVDRVTEFLISISKNLCELDRDVDIEVDGGAPTSRSGPPLDNGS